MARKIDISACVGCITQEENKKRLIHESACVDCGACQIACPKKCISKN